MLDNFADKSYHFCIMKYKLFTSESVTEGHPDKLCDLIADRVLDEALAGDPKSRVACEVCATTGFVFVFGEITTDKYIDVQNIVRDTIKSIGYDDAESGIDYKSCAVLTNIDEQSPDISSGVSSSLEARSGEADGGESVLGAGDQGMMFGYACNETPELMPLPIMLAHAVTSTLAAVRKSGELPYLRPDGKAQITVAYDGLNPVYVDTVVVSAQHNESVTQGTLRSDVIDKVIKKAIPERYLREDTKYIINPSGRFVVGGPNGDSGLTGRKIIVDTYGGSVAHGGGSFSGKDPTKVDRSASYYARYVCKNIVAAKIADRIELQVAYAIGKAHPVSLAVNTYGTGKYTDDEIVAAISKVFDFRPGSIIEQLGLRRPIYAKTTNYGHFGKSDMPWESTDKVDALKALLESRER